MKRFKGYRLLLSVALALAVGLLLAVAAPGFAGGGSQHTTSDVYWFDPFPTAGDRVDGASASLVTNEAGATMRIQTSGLTPGDAVTIWWVIFNNPEACAGYPNAACTMADLMGNTAAVGAEVTYATGNVIGGSGKGNFAAHLAPGHTTQEWFGNGFTNPTGAEIHLVVHTHGQKIPGLVDEMIGTYRAGCHDDAFINDSHPAHDDGTPGPNQCIDLQFAILRQGS
ncbi:MAG: hypothetical protein R3272_12335 [Candidatus Promineifilaceae bacterium]|nr:hypothetical protein [Candidatus Promineifilaceae bacterium]